MRDTLFLEGERQKRYIYLILYEAMDDFYSYKQGRNESLPDYYLNFKAKVDAIERLGGYDALVKEELRLDGMDSSTYKNLSQVSPTLVAEKRKKAEEKMRAIAFMKKSDPGRYGQLMIDLENQYTLGNNQYPETVTRAYNLICNYIPPHTQERQRSTRRTTRRGGTGGPVQQA